MLLAVAPLVSAADAAILEALLRIDRDALGPEDRLSHELFERERLQAEARSTIERTVIPAYARFERRFRESYLPRTRRSVGIWDTPDGAAWYANRVAHHTTTNLTPEEIHRIGLAEVARIRAEMDKIISQLGFKGDYRAFLSYLRNDPKFW